MVGAELRPGRLPGIVADLDSARTTYASLGAVAWLEDLERELAASRVGS